MKANNYYRALQIEDAYLKLKENEKNVLLGGGLWLKRSNSNYDTLIDLSNCGLDSIEETNDEYIIGSMATLRQVEVSNFGQHHLDGVMGDALNQIMGVPLRNSATIGGTIMGKFPFSDALTPLLTMDTTLEMYPARLVTLKDFLQEKRPLKEILVKIHVRKQDGHSRFKKVKLTDLGFAIINLCVSKINNQYLISVGARPGVASLAIKAMDVLNNNPLTDENIEKAADEAVNEMLYLDSNGNSKDYRQHLVRTYIQRLVKEIK